MSPSALPDPPPISARLAKSGAEKHGPQSGARQAPAGAGKNSEKQEAATTFPPPGDEVSAGCSTPGWLPVPVPRLLRRFSHLLILTILLAVPLIYPLQISEGLDYSITRRVVELQATGHSEVMKAAVRSAWIDQFQLALYSGYSPLLLKRFTWALLVLALTATHLMWLLWPNRPAERSTQRVTPEVLLFCGFLVWSALSLLFWLPAANSPAAPGVSPPRAGLLKGMDAWSDLAIAFGFFLLTADLLRRRRWVLKGAGLLIAGATMASALAIGQRMGWTQEFLTRWSPEDIRNRMSSLIGHNTGLSSYLMAPILISLALGFTQWRRLRRGSRIALIAFWFLMATTILMAQSRAIFLILLLAIPILLWLLHRTTGLSPGRSGWLVPAALVLAVLALQVIPLRSNPFYDPVSPLARRVNDLSLERLKAETRLRILACSVPLIVQSPLIGYGFNSFQYVYPRAQGEYFVEHPGTIVVPTGKRSEHAHNEYLQTLIETGAVGLLLALGALVMILRRGSRAFSLSIRHDDIPIQAGIIVAIGAVLAHAFVDFPFRVPPIAAPLVWMLAVWQAGENIWLPRSGRVDVDQDGEQAFERLKAQAGSPQSEIAKDIQGALAGMQGGPAGSAPAQGHGRKPAHWYALWGFSATVVLALAAVVSTWFSQRMVASTIAERAQRVVNTYLSGQVQTDARQKMDMLAYAESELRRALRLRPADGEIHFLKAYVHFNMGRDSLLQSRAAAAIERREQVSLWAARALSAANLGLSSLNLSLIEVSYHQSFHIRGNLHRLRASIEENPADRAQARSDFERTVRMSPSYHEGILDLVSLLETSYPEAVQERYDLLELLYRWNPDIFRREFVFKGGQAFSEGRYEDAATWLRDLAKAVPNDPLLLSSLAVTYLQSGDFERAESVLTELAQLKPRPVEYDVVAAGIAIERKEWPRALAHVEQALRHPDGDRDLHRIFQFLILEQMGEEQRARSGLEAMERRARRNLNVYLDLVTALADRFHDLGRAVPYIHKYLEQAGGPGAPKLYWYLAKYALDTLDDPEAAIKHIEQGLQVDPQNRELLEIKRRIESRRERPAEAQKKSNAPEPPPPHAPQATPAPTPAAPTAPAGT